MTVFNDFISSQNTIIQKNQQVELSLLDIKFRRPSGSFRSDWSSEKSSDLFQSDLVSSLHVSDQVVSPGAVITT